MKSKILKCPSCGNGAISFRWVEEKIKGSDKKIHLVTVRLGLCDRCKERIWPRESVLKVEEIRKPAAYTLDIPVEIAARLVRSAARKQKSFKQLAIEKLSK